MVTIELAIAISALAVAMLCLFVLLVLLLVLASKGTSTAAAVAPAATKETQTSTYLISYIILTDRTAENARVPEAERVVGVAQKVMFRILTNVTPNTNMLKVFNMLIHMANGTEIVPQSISALPTGSAAFLPPTLTLDTTALRGPI